MNITISLKARAAGSRRIYSNYVCVSVSPNDCSLFFCDIPPLATSEELLKARQNGSIEADPIIEIAIPTTLMPRLAAVIMTQYENSRGKVDGWENFPEPKSVQ